MGGCNRNTNSVYSKKVFDRNSRAQDRIKYKDILFYSFSLYINKPFKKTHIIFKLIGKKLQWYEFCEIGVFDSLTRGIMRFKVRVKGYRLAWFCELICDYLVNYLINQYDIKITNH